MKFKAHNILLGNGEFTMGPDTVLLSKSKVWNTIKKSILLFYPDYNRAFVTRRVVDLGCLEGGYTVEFARMGFETLGIEIRQGNMDKCNYIKKKVGLSNLKFIKDNVRNLKEYGEFDITFCFGLLYHLQDPVSFIEIISECTKDILILNTHYAPEQDFRYRMRFFNQYFFAPLQNKFRILENRKNYQLSSLTENEGYRGRWYREWSKNEKKEVVEGMIFASYNNHRSFWLCKRDLSKALIDAGFRHVFELFDYSGDIFPVRSDEFYSRGMFIALKRQ